MEGIRTEMLTFCISGVPIAAIRLIASDRVQISFCFSQVSAVQVLINFVDKMPKSHLFNIDETKQMIYSMELPDFSDQETIELDLFNSLFLSSGFDVLVLRTQQNWDMDACLEYFIEQPFGALIIPRAKIEEFPAGYSELIDLSAHYYIPQPPRVELYYSKRQLGQTEMVTSSRLWKKRLRKSSLPDVSLYSMDVIEGPGAQMFSFIDWIGAINEE